MGSSERRSRPERMFDTVSAAQLRAALTVSRVREQTSLVRGIAEIVRFSFYQGENFHASLSYYV